MTSTWHVARVVAALIVMILILVGNVVNIVVIRKAKTIPRNARYFMLSLCLTDLGVGAAIAFTMYPLATGHWPYGDTACIAVGIVTHTLSVTSIIALLALSIERYLAMVRPLKYSLLATKGRAIAINAAIWISVTLFSIVISLIQGPEFFSFNANQGTCVAHYELPKYRNSAFFSAIVFIFIPTTVMIAIYLVILSSSYKHARIVTENRNESSNRSTNPPPPLLPSSTSSLPTVATPTIDMEHTTTSRNNTIVVTMFIVTGTFVICYYPYAILSLYTAATGNTASPAIAFAVRLLLRSNSFLNTFIYGYRYRFVRAACTSFLRCYFLKPRSRVTPDESLRTVHLSNTHVSMIVEHISEQET
ncbi:beta-3 adrenergic receptor-like [Saccoglossus kowalevskii]|uniref:Octopamine receptor beta-2R-like n=1 Tax=Saccoglossus kowalevskii TaxID=10224 RepID=A0ABM0M3Y7_SACKO|nr:PREDICTED: octopamine receptor beta-2R-like [Saccoglossus kowalevskii]